jgi:hypothetical protein
MSSNHPRLHVNTYPVLQAPGRLALPEFFRRLVLFEMLFLRHMPFAVRHDLAHVLLVFFRILGGVLLDSTFLTVA